MRIGVAVDVFIIAKRKWHVEFIIVIILLPESFFGRTVDAIISKAYIWTVPIQGT